MQYINAALLLTSLAVAAPILDRRADNTQAILNDFNNLVGQVQQLDNTVNSFSDNAIFVPFTTLDDIYNESNAIQSTGNQLSSDASSSTPFSVSDAQAINNAYSSLQNTMFTTLSDIIAHEPAVSNAGYKSQVETGLKNMQSQFAAVSKSIKSKQPASTKKALAAITKQYAQHFAAAVATYA